MNYTPTNWQNGDIITADKLNKIENGVVGISSIETYNPTNWKNGDVITSEKLNKIENGIANAGSSGSMSPKQVNFIDYDGTIVAAYAADDFLALSAMPENPSHEGLVAQGWNWSLADAKAYLTDYPEAKLSIGQMYATESGATEIDIELVAPRLSPVLTICVNGTVTVDWGDNTTPDTVTGSSLETRLGVPHTYSAAGAYTIKIAPVSESDTYAFYGDDVDYSYAYTLLRKNGEEIPPDENLVYANAIRAIRLGRGSVILSNAFGNCYSLASVTIPSDVTSIEVSAFSNCYSLASVTIPEGVTSIGTDAFVGCYSLASVTIPSDVTSIGTSAFNSCSALTSVTIPSGVTSIGEGMFSYCSSLASVTIPSDVTSIGTSAFNSCSALTSVTIPSGVTSIGADTFVGCYSLASVTIPEGVTSIGANAFSGCCGVAEYHMRPVDAPTMGINAFELVSDMVIYVPAGSMLSYQDTGSWSEYALYLREEPSA